MEFIICDTDISSLVIWPWIISYQLSETDFNESMEMSFPYANLFLLVPQEKATRIPADKLNATMYFPMPFSLTETSLEKATLLIYVDTPPGYEGQQVTLNVLTNPWAKTVLSRPMTLTSGGHWEHIDITEQCITWLKHEWENNLGLVVEAEVMGIDLINYSSNHSSSNRSLERVSSYKSTGVVASACKSLLPILGKGSKNFSFINPVLQYTRFKNYAPT